MPFSGSVLLFRERLVSLVVFLSGGSFERKVYDERFISYDRTVSYGSVMAYLNTLRQLVSDDLKALICHVSSLDESSPKFRKFEENAWSVIVHRYYPSVSKQWALTTIDDFIDKFRIHGFPEKARNLKKLIDRYVQLDYFKKYAQTQDLQWRLLALLIKLSYRPTNVLEDDKPIVLPAILPSSKSSDFDWGAYLKEGSEKFMLPSSSDDESEWELSEDEVEEIFFDNGSECERKSSGMDCSSDSQTETIVTEEDISKTIMKDKTNQKNAEIEVLKELLAADKWLEKNGQFGWMDNPNLREIPPSKHSSANLCFHWEEIMSQDNNTGVQSGETKVLTEYKVMRELIWALNSPVPDDCYIIRKIGSEFQVAEKVSIASLSPVMFSEFLNTEVCPYLPFIVELNKFQTDVRQMCILDRHLPNTYLAYSHGLGDILNRYVEKLCQIESRVSKQEGIMTMTSVLNEIRPWLRNIAFIHSVHKEAVFDDWKNMDNWVCSVRLLSVLFKHLICVIDWNKHAVLKLFLWSLQPYMAILGTWLGEVRFVDDKDEFVITRPATSPQEGHLLVRNYKTNLMELGIEDTSFLDSIVDVAFRAVSSIDFLVQLEKASAVRQECFQRDALFNEFIRTLEVDLMFHSFIKKSEVEYANEISENQLEINTEKDELPSLYLSENETLNPFVSNKFLENPGLLNSQDFYIQPSTLTKIAFELYNKRREPIFIRAPTEVLMENLQNREIGTVPVDVFIRRRAHDTIVKYMRPRGFASEILLKEYKLLEHLESLRKIYFLQAGRIMHMFTTLLFSEMMKGNMWSVSWTNKLSDFIAEEMPQYASKFSIFVKPKFHKLHISELDSITRIELKYKPDGPLSLIITDDIISTYNKLFIFFLQLKWSLYTLHKLHFKDLMNENTILVRRLYSLRMWLLHTVSALHRYFMTLEILEFEKKIADLCSVARDLHTIVAAHREVLEIWETHCFLTESHPCSDLMQRVFELCENMRFLWCLGEQLHSWHCQVGSFEEKYEKVIADIAKAVHSLDSSSGSDAFEILHDEIMNNIPLKMSES